MPWKSYQCTNPYISDENPACGPHETLCENCTSRECDKFQSQMESCGKIDTVCDICQYMKEERD